MKRRPPRGLSPDERALWNRVAASANPMGPPARLKEAAETTPGPKRAFAAPRAAIGAFAIGQNAPRLPAGHDLRRPLEEEVARRPLRMDHGTHRKLQRGRLAPEARIDLHGMTLAEAHPALIRFLFAQQADARRLVLVITGKGRPDGGDGPMPQRIGALRHQVPHWLAQPPLGQVVQQVLQAHPRHGGTGAFYVYLRR
ncbi:MAG: Smr/MutS family protein [Defluviimonas sp.]|uniref:Smr/MutS family protein n=1 Tax=Albidovulum sp. TaxID=1872424 RepID=UPI002A25E22E|nr:Smr/MutS family protein [Defluviimonas sp.]